MNVTGVILAILLLIGIITGIGYGTYTGYEFLSGQWLGLSNDWRAILILAAAMLAACTLFLALFIQATLRQYGLKGSGKVIAYNAFLTWYSELKNNPEQIPSPESFRQMTNQMTLWGNQRVIKQVHILFDLLQDNGTEKDQLLKNADLLYIEIRRDLGLRGTNKYSNIL